MTVFSLFSIEKQDSNYVLGILETIWWSAFSEYYNNYRTFFYNLSLWFLKAKQTYPKSKNFLFSFGAMITYYVFLRLVNRLFFTEDGDSSHQLLIDLVSCFSGKQNSEVLEAMKAFQILV